MNRYLTVLISCLIVLFSSCATESSETPQEVDKPSDYFSGVWVTSSASSVMALIIFSWLCGIMGGHIIPVK